MIRKVGSLVFAIVSTVSVTATVRDDVYNEGFKEGYSTAGKEFGGLAPIKPIAPLTPMPKLGEITPRDTYNRAIIDGYKKYKQERGPLEWDKE